MAIKNPEGGAPACRFAADTERRPVEILEAISIIR
jgi:hypothetical protein